MPAHAEVPSHESSLIATTDHPAPSLACEESQPSIVPSSAGVADGDLPPLCIEPNGNADDQADGIGVPDSLLDIELGQRDPFTDPNNMLWRQTAPEAVVAPERGRAAVAVSARAAARRTRGGALGETEPLQPDTEAGPAKLAKRNAKGATSTKAKAGAAATAAKKAAAEKAATEVAATEKAAAEAVAAEAAEAAAAEVVAAEATAAEVTAAEVAKKKATAQKKKAEKAAAEAEKAAAAEKAAEAKKAAAVENAGAAEKVAAVKAAKAAERAAESAAEGTAESAAVAENAGTKKKAEKAADPRVAKDRRAPGYTRQTRAQRRVAPEREPEPEGEPVDVEMDVAVVPVAAAATHEAAAAEGPRPEPPAATEPASTPQGLQGSLSKPADRTRAKRNELAALAAQQRLQNAADLAEFDGAAEALQRSVAKEVLARFEPAPHRLADCLIPCGRAARLQKSSRKTENAARAKAVADKAAADKARYTFFFTDLSPAIA